MKKKYLKIVSFISLLSILFFTLAFGPLIFGPGIQNATPIDPYINGVFPSLTPTAATSENTSYNVENAFPNLTFIDPVDMLELPDSNEFLILGLQGHIWKISNDQNTTTKQLLLNITDNVVVNTDGGMLGVVLHPEYGQTGSVNSEYIYVFYRYTPVQGTDGTGASVKGYMRLSRFNLPVGGNSINPSSEQVLINIYDRNDWHNGGDMFFGPEDGFLYLAVGDEGSANDSYGVTQQIDKWLFGGVLRLDVDQRGGAISHAIRKQPLNRGTPPDGWEDSYTQGYYIPNDNPWQDTNGGLLEEFYAIGTRSPHRMTIDPPTGDIWIGDIGQSAKEEISVVRKGDNLQWPYREGDQTGPKEKPTPLIGNDRTPIHAYGRNIGTCIIGGFVYRGSRFPELDGKYLFGDQTTQNVSTLTKTGENTGDVNYLLHVPVSGVGSKDGISSFFMDSNEDVFILDLFGTARDGGVIRKLVRSGPTLDPPEKLSDLNVFTDLQNLTPIDGLIPYDVNTPLWSDGAKKRRWIALPNDGNHDTALEQIDFENEENWSFPSGTVMIKQFDLPTDENDPTKITKLETRFIVFTEDNVVYGVTYKWNDEQTDAFLIGIDEEISQNYNVTKNDGSIVTQTWDFPSRSQCIQCHNSVAGYALGLKTRQLNKSYTYPSSGITSNQLETWSHLKMFSEEIEPHTDLPASANINADLASDEMKVRSYIDANCAYCHRPNGVESAFDGRSLIALYDQLLIDTDVVSHASLPGYKIIKPQDAENSMLYIRDNSSAEDRMPPIGRNLIDEDYMEVLTSWIEGLDENGPKTVTNGQYTFQARHSSKFMAVNDASNEDDAIVVEIPSNIEDNSNWDLEQLGNKKYRIKAKHSNMVLSIRDLRTDRGVNVIQEPWNGRQHQLWYFEDAPEGYVRIVNAYNGLVLKSLTSSNEENKPLVLWTKDNTAQDQQWKITPPVTRVTGVTLNPESISLFQGETSILTADVSPSNASDTSMTWLSSDTNIATVDSDGNVTAIAAGEASITATTNDGGFTAVATITVKAAVTGITVDPENANLAVGDTRILTVGVVPSNASDTAVTWASSDTNIATVNANGRVTAIAEGNTTITVTTNEGAFTAESIITVTGPVNGVTVNPQTVSLVEGESKSLTAQVSPSNAVDTSITWFSSDSNIATVNANGRVTAIAAGNVTITVTTTDGGFTAQSVITVFRPTVNATGVTVSPDTANLNPGNSTSLTAQLSPANASNTSVTWVSSDTTIATVDADGNVSAIAAGNATITVTTNDGGFTTEATITVVQAIVAATGVTVDPLTVSVTEGSTSVLTAAVSPANASNTSVTWVSSDTTIATVDADGNISAIAAGNATITVTTNDGGFTAEATITVAQAIVSVTGVTVDPLTVNVTEGSTSVLTAVVSPANASNTSVTWVSSDTTIATVDADGNISAIAAGNATITVTTNDGGFTAEATITVVQAIVAATGVTVDPLTVSVTEGNTSLLTAAVSPANASNTSVTWVSSDTTIATVDADGNISAIAVGEATITATTTDGGFTAEATITVTQAIVAVTGVTVDPLTVSVTEGSTSVLAAVVSPANASNTSVTWVSSDTTIATVDADGNISAIAAGNATITVTTNDGGFTAEATITVVQAIVAVTGVTVDPLTVSVTEGNTSVLTAAVSPANASNTSVTWASSDTTIATVDTDGNISAIAVGNATITVTTNDGGFSAQTNIIVLAGNGQDCSATGSITMRRYDNIPGISLNNLFNATNFPDSPSTTVELDSFEIPAYVSNNYGAWLSGYICAPETGTYYFWVSGDDYVRLNLSTNTEVANKTTIAYHNGHTNNRTWDKYDSQKSIGIQLVQGQSYYVEGYMKEGVGGDHFAVGWRKPSDGIAAAPSEIIPGSVLSSDQDSSYEAGVTGVSINRTYASILEGATTTLVAQVSPSNAANQSVTWQSSDTNIATVTPNGTVTAVSAGNTIITVTSNDGGFRAQSNITVREENDQNCSATGTITMKRYDGIGGISLNNLFLASNFPDNPSRTQELNSFEIPAHVANNYGAWVSGYLCAPETGTYYFWVSGDNHVQLNLSADDDMANSTTIAFHEGHTNTRRWDKYESQKSIAIELEQGRSYYIEAYLKELNGGDHLSVGWSKPSDASSDLPSEVIPGNVLSPNNAQSFPFQASLREFITVSIINIYPNPTSEIINIETSANEKIKWLYMFDSIGKAVMELPQSEFRENQQNHVINVAHLAKGVYTILIITDDLQEHTEKIIVR